MIKIYEMNNDRAVMLYSRGSQLVLRHKTGEMIGRPITMAYDYKGGFAGTIYNDTVFYVYENDSGQIVLKNINDSVIYYRTNAGNGAAPLLFVLGFKLLLVYYSDGINFIQPFDRINDKVLSADVSWVKTIRSFDAGESRLIFISGDKFKIYMLDKYMNISELKNEDEINAAKNAELDALRLSFEGEIEEIKQKNSGELEEVRRQKDREIEEIKQKNSGELEEVRRQKDREIEEIKQKNSGELEEVRRQKDREIEEIKQNNEDEIKELYEVIESIKKQYNELMSIAEQYKAEALKWREKYTF